MRVVSVCFALVFVSTTFVATARAQSLEDNEHYQSFKSWAIDTQQAEFRSSSVIPSNFPGSMYPKQMYFIVPPYFL